MRAALTLVGGSSARASVSAAALATCGFLVTGYGAEIVRTAAYAAVWLMAVAALWFVLSLAGSLAGDGDGVPAQEDVDRGI